MGELHLEVIRERIRAEYKIEADLGPMQIAYREKLKDKITDSYEANHTIGKSNCLKIIKLASSFCFC